MLFRSRELSYTNNIGINTGSPWDTSPWNTSNWAVDTASDINSQWLMCSGVGFKVSVVFKTQTRGILVDWYDTGVRFDVGTGIV